MKETQDISEVFHTILIYEQLDKLDRSYSLVFQ